MYRLIGKSILLITLALMHSKLSAAEPNIDEGTLERRKGMKQFLSDPQIITVNKSSVTKIETDEEEEKGKELVIKQQHPKRKLLEKLGAHLGAAFNSFHDSSKHRMIEPEDIVNLTNKNLTKSPDKKKNKTAYRSRTDEFSDFDENRKEVEGLLFESLKDYNITNFVVQLSKLELFYKEYDLPLHAINAQNLHDNDNTPGHIILRDMSRIDTFRFHVKLGLRCCERILIEQYEKGNLNLDIKNRQGIMVRDYMNVMNQDGWALAQKVQFNKLVNAIQK